MLDERDGNRLVDQNPASCAALLAGISSTRLREAPLPPASDGNFDRDYSHQLRPTRDDFYDYGSKGYMSRPRDTGKPSAMGPYVDYGRADDYLVTVSVPVTPVEGHQSRFDSLSAHQCLFTSVRWLLLPRRCDRSLRCFRSRQLLRRSRR